MCTWKGGNLLGSYYLNVYTQGKGETYSTSYWFLTISMNVREEWSSTGFLPFPLFMNITLLQYDTPFIFSHHDIFCLLRHHVGIPTHHVSKRLVSQLELLSGIAAHLWHIVVKLQIVISSLCMWPDTQSILHLNGCKPNQTGLKWSITKHIRFCWGLIFHVVALIKYQNYQWIENIQNVINI